MGVLYNRGLLNWLFVADLPLLDTPWLLGWLKQAPVEHGDIEAAAIAEPPPVADAADEGAVRTALRILLDMGFDRNRALAALRAGGSIAGAINVLSPPQ